jgi:hypothetical protein
MGAGRPTDAELREVRERVEELMLAGLKPGEIRRALAGSSRPLSEQSVERHCRAVREGWRARNADLEAERAEMVAQVREAARVAVSRATLYSKSNLGVGYLNVHLKALERLARLLGLDAPARTELTGRDGGPLSVAMHPSESLSPAEQAERLRGIAAELDAAEQ